MKPPGRPARGRSMLFHSRQAARPMMQAMKSSRYLTQLSWEANVAVRTGASAVSAPTRTNAVRTPLQQHQASFVATSTPCGALDRAAVRQLTTGSRITQPRPSLPRIFWRASASSRLNCLHGTHLCRSSSSSGSSSSSSSSLTAAGAAALPRGVSIDRGPREPRESPAAAMPSRRGMSSSAMSEREFHLIADEALEDIHDAVEEALEDGFAEEFDCNMSQGVLNIVVGDRGTWVLNKQSPNRQIWWSSPVSGPMRFEYHDNSKRWLNTRDGETELRDLLAKEMSEKCGVSLC